MANSTKANYVEVRCEGTVGSNGNRFDLIRADNEELQFFDSRFDSLITTARVNSELSLEPSTSDPLKLKITTPSTTYHCKAEEQNMIVLFTDFMIKKKDSSLNESIGSNSNLQLKHQMSQPAPERPKSIQYQQKSISVTKGESNQNFNVYTTDQSSEYNTTSSPPKKMTQSTYNDRSYMFESHHHPASNNIYEERSVETLYNVQNINDTYIHSKDHATTDPSIYSMKNTNPYISDHPENTTAPPMLQQQAQQLILNGNPIHMKERPKHLPGVKKQTSYNSEDNGIYSNTIQSHNNRNNHMNNSMIIQAAPSYNERIYNNQTFSTNTNNGHIQKHTIQYTDNISNNSSIFHN